MCRQCSSKILEETGREHSRHRTGTLARFPPCEDQRINEFQIQARGRSVTSELYMKQQHSCRRFNLHPVELERMRTKESRNQLILESQQTHQNVKLGRCVLLRIVTSTGAYAFNRSTSEPNSRTLHTEYCIQYAMRMIGMPCQGAGRV